MIWLHAESMHLFDINFAFHLGASCQTAAQLGGSLELMGFAQQVMPWNAHKPCHSCAIHEAVLMQNN